MKVQKKKSEADQCFCIHALRFFIGILSFLKTSLKTNKDFIIIYNLNRVQLMDGKGHCFIYSSIKILN